LQELLNLVAAKAVDAIILGKLDRLTRKVGTLSAIWRACKENGVELHFADLGKADDTPMGKFFLKMLENVYELEADNINVSMQGGKQTKIASGKILGIGACGPYGHMFEGQGKDKRLAINPDEAKIVQLMRDWVLYEGMGTQKIAKRLTEMKIPTPGSTRKLTT